MDFLDTDVFGPLARKPAWGPPPPLAKPDPGDLLLERVAGRMLKITRPDGSYVSMFWTPGHALELKIRKEGVPAHKIERVLNHVWEYRSAYVSCNDVD